MDRQTLIRAMGNEVISDEECAAFNQAMRQADCTNVNRAAMWCAQLGHESVGLRHYSEIWGPTRDQLTYQGRMGNVNPGDGYRFRGRGPIQVTGRNNYTAVSRWAFDRGYAGTPDEFVRNPELLADVRWGFLGAVWYWTTQRPLNDLSDRRDLEGATRAINGGLNGIDDRRTRYQRCLTMGEALLPDEGDGFMAGEAQSVLNEMLGPEGRGWPVTLYDRQGERRTLVAMVGEIFTKALSKLPVTGGDPRPLPLDQADDLFGHVLSLRAEVAELKALLTSKETDA